MFDSAGALNTLASSVSGGISSYSRHPGIYLFTCAQILNLTNKFTSRIKKSLSIGGWQWMMKHLEFLV